MIWPFTAALLHAAVVHSAAAQVSKSELESISIPDRVETLRLVIEKFFDGVPPTPPSTSSNDNLDPHARAAKVYLDNVEVFAVTTSVP